jgi:hypothetical protein
LALDRTEQCCVLSLPTLTVEDRLQRDPEKFKLNKEEIQAIAFVNEYYPLKPL